MNYSLTNDPDILAARRKAYFSGNYTFDSTGTFRPKTEQERRASMTPEQRDAESVRSMNAEASRLNAMSGLRAAQERVRKDQEAEEAKRYRESINNDLMTGNYGRPEVREEAMRRGLISRPTPQQPSGGIGRFVNRLEGVRATTGR